MIGISVPVWVTWRQMNLSFKNTMEKKGRSVPRGFLLAMAWMVGASNGYSLLFTQHYMGHALCCGAVGVEGFSVRDGGMAPKPVFSEASVPLPMSMEGNETVGKKAEVAMASKPAEPAVKRDPLEKLPPIPEINGVLQVEFDRLAGYEVKTPEVFRSTAETPIQVDIPASLRAISGREVVVRGFMLPLKMDGRSTTEFLLMRDQSLCCFGRVPMLNEWVYVRMPKGTTIVNDIPVSYRGKLTVGELLDDGYLIGIYLLDGEKQVKE